MEDWKERWKEEWKEVWENSWARGWVENWEKGWMESREKVLLDVVRNLLRMGLSADFIAAATGLPPAEVERLAAGMR